MLEVSEVSAARAPGPLLGAAPARGEAGEKLQVRTSVQARPAFQPLCLSNRLLFLVVSFAAFLSLGPRVGISVSEEPWTHLSVHQFFSAKVLLPSRPSAGKHRDPGAAEASIFLRPISNGFLTDSREGGQDTRIPATLLPNRDWGPFSPHVLSRDRPDALPLRWMPGQGPRPRGPVPAPGPTQDHESSRGWKHVPITKQGRSRRMRAATPRLPPGTCRGASSPGTSWEVPRRN